MYGQRLRSVTGRQPHERLLRSLDRRNREVVAVLDVDSAEYDQFNEIDQQYLEEIVSLILFD